MFEPKVPAICGAIGFVLSFLIGLIRGAAFFIVLLRAVIMAVMFAGLALGVRFLLQRFVPELLSPAGEAVDEVDDSGNVVNITIGENERDGMPFSGTGSPEQDSSLPDFLQSARKVDDAGTESPDFQARSGSDSASLQDSASSTGGMAAGVSPSFAKPQTGTGMADGLDVLPDLEDFLPEVKTEADSEAVPEKVSSGGSDGSSRFESSDLSGAAVESETMAKAIRTILSRDA